MSWRAKLTALLMRAIWRLNRHKDRGLAYELHGLADLYDTRPIGEWKRSAAWNWE